MRRIFLAIGVLIATCWIGAPAEAACHFFTVGSSTSVSEGGTVNVVVERDGTVNDSSVRVRAINGTAKAPGDYTAFDQRVSFTGDQTQKTVSIKTRDDLNVEGNEAFQVQASEGQGCQVNPNYQYGAPALVTIKDNDTATAAPTATPPAPTTTTTIIPATTATPSPSPTPTESATPTPSTTASLTPLPTFTPVNVDEDGGFPWLPVLAVVGFLAAGAGALILTRLRGLP